MKVWGEIEFWATCQNISNFFDGCWHPLLRWQNRLTWLVNQSSITCIISDKWKFLTPASTKLLVQGVIMASIDYFNGLLYGVPAVRLSKLQRLQYSAARLITHTPRYCHITPLLLALHWLPVKFRIFHKNRCDLFQDYSQYGACVFK